MLNITNSMIIKPMAVEMVSKLTITLVRYLHFLSLEYLVTSASLRFSATATSAGLFFSEKSYNIWKIAILSVAGLYASVVRFFFLYDSMYVTG